MESLGQSDEDRLRMKALQYKKRTSSYIYLRDIHFVITGHWTPTFINLMKAQKEAAAAAREAARQAAIEAATRAVSEQYHEPYDYGYDDDDGEANRNGNGTGTGTGNAMDTSLFDEHAAALDFYHRSKSFSIVSKKYESFDLIAFHSETCQLISRTLRKLIYQSSIQSKRLAIYAKANRKYAFAHQQQMIRKSHINSDLEALEFDIFITVCCSLFCLTLHM